MANCDNTVFSGQNLVISKKKKKRSPPKFKRFFPAKVRWSKKKKKKKKKVFANIQSEFSAEIQNSNVFSAQN